MADERISTVGSVMQPRQDCICVSAQSKSAIKKIDEALESMPPDPNKTKEAVKILQKDSTVKWSDQKLKQCLIDGTCTTADALQEALSKEDDGQGTRRKVIHHAGHALKSDLTALRIVAENGSDDLNHQDKKEVAVNLKNSLNHAKAITNSPTLLSFLGECGCKLKEWVSNFSNWIMGFFNEVMAEDEKKKEEEKCEQRKEEKKEIDKYCRIMKNAGRKKNDYYLSMEHVKSKILQFRESKKHNFTKDELSKLTYEYSLAKSKYKEEGTREDYYKNKEEDIKEFLPPSSVCHGSGLSLELDISC